MDASSSTSYQLGRIKCVASNCYRCDIYNRKRELAILFIHKHNIQNINKLSKISLQPKMTANSRQCLNASGEPSRQSRTAGE
ncbi:hypothetical protein YC2023_075900 [Brassica napus]